MDDLLVDDRGFIWVGKFRLPVRYIPERETLEFIDKDRRRSDERGSRFIEVPARMFGSLPGSADHASGNNDDDGKTVLTG